MTPLLLLALLVPGLYWDKGVETAPQLKQAGIERLCVPAASVDAWRAAGLTAEPAALVGREKLEVPRVQWRINIASATRSPWIDANGWRFARKPDAKYLYEPPSGAAPLAAAEAFAYGADALLRIDPADLVPLGRMLTFCKQVERPAMPVMANIGIVDDGSETLGEVLNLFARRNLLFRVVTKPDPRCDLNIRLGSPEFPTESAQDPNAFAAKVREKLTDDKRLLRVYGSQVVIGRLTGDGTHVRVQLLNYGGRKVYGMRVRVLGVHQRGTLHAEGIDNAALADYMASQGATEFTIPEMGPYAVVDLE